jgi:hypothetical protein
MTELASRTTPDLTLLGPVVRLQVQTAALVAGERGRRTFDPAPLREVDSLRLTPNGVLGITGDGEVMDVHHRDHPASKWGGNNGVSVLFTHHYRLMRDRFGPHLTDGIAGENILVVADRRIELEDLKNGLGVETADGPVRLHNLMTAEPCVEYTRYSLRRSPYEPADPVMTDALTFLRAGMRGFYARFAGEEMVVRPGDRVYLASGSNS